MSTKKSRIDMCTSDQRRYPSGGFGQESNHPEAGADVGVPRLVPAVGFVRRGAKRYGPRPCQEDPYMLRASMLAALLAVSLSSSSAWAWNRGRATRFATLPKGTAHPEGLTVDAAGNVYVANFDVDRAAGPGQLVVFDRSGEKARVVNVAGSSNLLLGLDFHRLPGSGIELLVIDFGGKTVLRVDPNTGASTVFTTIPGGAGPNALTFDDQRNVYISDSFQGIIWQTAPTGGAATVWAQSPLLTTTGVPP